MRIRRAVYPAAVLTLVALVAACGSSGNSGAPPQSVGGVSGAAAATAPVPDVLHMAFSADMPDPDPDIFYFTEGNAIVTNVYDDLVQYAPNDSYTLVGDLAESWMISPDARTYTFHLRPNVQFHTGGTMTSRDVEFSFERRSSSKVNSPMAYLTDDITGYATPDPSTFVVHLAKPDIFFLSNLASPYGVKVISQTAVMAHAVNGDLGQAWLKTHDAGTGPFTIQSFQPEHYVLSRFAGYWGPQPQLSGVDITVVPSSTTQLLELESGQLQLIIHGLTVAELNRLAKNPKYQVDNFPATFKLWLQVNMHKSTFSSDAVRTALAEAINRKLITSDVYGPYGSPGVDFYIPGEVPAGQAADNPPYDPGALRKLLPTMTDKKVNIVYTTDDAVRNQQAAEIVQTELQADGLDATVSGVPLSEGFTYWGQNPSLDPDIMIVDGNPDSGNADDYARPFIGTVGVGNNGSLNSFHCTVPGVDALLDKGLYSTSMPSSIATYVTIGQMAVSQGCMESLTQIGDAIVADAGYGNLHHQIATVWSIRFGDITLNKS
jgi:peptide/nickel transport system substrate-binding protein